MAEQSQAYLQTVINTCLQAGKIMITGGSEMYRVEDTMLRIAKNAGLEDPRVFATPTGVFVSLNGGELSQLKQVRNRDINLELVARVNDLSRQFAAGKIDLYQLADRLNVVAIVTPSFSLPVQVLGAAIVSATLMVLFTGQYDWYDFPAAAVIGALGWLFYYGIKKPSKIRFLSEMLAAVFMGAVAIGLAKIFPVLQPDNILIGALMTLVPGVALVNALRDLFSGDLLSGIARGVEAALTAGALGGGVGLIMKFFGG